MKPRTYTFNNSTLTIIFGDITTSQAEVIVSSDDTGISMGGGVSKSILKKGGEYIKADAQRKLPTKLGDVMVSTAGDLTYQKYIFHCISIDYNNEADSINLRDYIIQHSVDKCFQLLQALEINSIAFPCIGGGRAGIPLDKIAEIMSKAISTNLCKTNRPYQIELYLLDHMNKLTDMDFIDLFENFAASAAVAKAMAELKMKQYTKENTNENASIEMPSIEEMNHEVFISYSRKNKEKVKKICDILTQHHIVSWIDTDNISSGDRFKAVIAHAIDKAKVVLFFSSEDSNKSEFVHKEIDYAFSMNKSIIPIRLDDSQYSKDLILDLTPIDHIDWFLDEEEAEKRLLDSLTFKLKF